MTEIKTIRFLSIIGCLLAGMAASCSSRQVAPNEEGISVQNSTKVFMLLTLLQIQFSCGEK